MSEGNIQVFIVILTSALVVILARLLGPLEIYEDLGANLGASHRLIQGLGLTIASGLDFDLNQTPHPEYLTKFPPGSSILMASLLFLKIPLVISLKIIYSLTTVIGWICWAGIACHFLTKPIRFSSILLPIHLIIAAILPLFYTPSWTNAGTDIYLWSGTPLIILLLFYSSLKSSKNYFVVLAGLLFGFLVSLRYISCFLAFAALLILLQVNFPKIKVCLHKYFLFLLTSLVFIAPIFIYINLVKTQTYGHVANLLNTTEKASIFTDSIHQITDSIHQIFKHFATTSIMSGFITTRLINIIEQSFISFAYKISCIVLIVLLPFLVIKIKKINLKAIHKDISISIACLPISLVLFLGSLTFTLSWSPIGIARYYISVNICLILIFYEIATLININRRFKVITSAFVILFLTYNLVYRPSFLFIGKSKVLVEVVLGFRPLPTTEYPSNKIYIPDNDSLLMLRKLEQENPQALFFVQRFYSSYIYNNQSTVRRILDESFWEQAYLSKNTRIFWIVDNQQQCETICNYEGKPIKYISSLPNLKTVYISSHKKRKIMVSDLPSGYKFFEN